MVILMWILVSTSLLVEYRVSSNTMEFYRDDFVEFIKSENLPQTQQFSVDGQPTIVIGEMVIESLDSFDENDMAVSLTFLLKLSYYNHYLSKFAIKDEDHVDLAGETADQLWTPELFFLKNKRVFAHNTFLPNKKYTYYVGGNVTYSSRYSLTVGCPLDLQRYPFDKQICWLEMQSFIHDDKNVVLKWTTDKPVVFVENSIGSLRNFRLVENGTYELTSRTKEGNFSRLSIKLAFTRNMGHNLIQMYVTCIISVIMSWISFWIDVSAILERLGFGVMTVLIMIMHNVVVNLQLPSTPYAKAIDVYMLACLILVFLALLQYIIVYTYAQKRPADEDDDRKTRSRHHIAQRIDFVSRIVFPSVFLVFNVAYWGFFLSA